MGSLRLFARSVQIVLNAPLSTPEKVVLVAILTHGSEQCFPGIRRLAALTSQSERTVQRAIKSCEAKKVLGVSKRGNPGFQESNRYRVRLGKLRELRPSGCRFGDSVSPGPDCVSPGDGESPELD